MGSLWPEGHSPGPMILTITLHPALDKIVRTPRLRPNDAARVTIVMEYGGGKGNNVARALHRLGVPVLALGFQGGHIGEELMRRFAEEGIRTDFVSCRAPTRTSLMIIEEETGHTYSLYEPGQAVETDELERFRNRVLNRFPEGKMVLFCGTARTPELAALNAELIHAAQQRGLRCGVDSSGLALRESIRARPYLVKVNRDELSEWCECPLDDLSSQLQAMHELHQMGVSLVALSRGAEGLLITDGQTWLEGKLPMDKVINVMGCGDSLLAGMASALLDGLDLEGILRRGVACGAANTQVIGSGFIDPALVRQLEPRVDVQMIAFHSSQNTCESGRN